MSELAATAEPLRPAPEPPEAVGPIEPPIPRPGLLEASIEAEAPGQDRFPAPAPADLTGPSGPQEGECQPGKPWLRWFSEKGWCIHLPFSRLSAAWIAWVLAVMGLVDTISKRTVQRWLAADHIRPWRFRSWITPKDLTTFLARATGVLDLYARVRGGSLAPGEVVYSIDEKPSIQARHHATYKAASNGKPAKLEHTYKRQGALQLVAAFNVAVGEIFGRLVEGKNFAMFSGFVAELLQHAVASGKTTIHLILDNASAHRPKFLETWIKSWLEEQQLAHVQVVVHWLPVRSSWLNQVEIFFSLLQAQALTPNNFADLDALRERILGFIALWNAMPRTFDWTYTSEDLIHQFAPPAASGPANRSP